MSDPCIVGVDSLEWLSFFVLGSLLKLQEEIMNQRRSKIRPMHLVLVGVGIVIIGTLVPSAIVNAYSTIGLSLMIGGLVLLSAYILFCVNTVRAKGASTIGWLLLPVLVVGLGVGGLYAYNQHQQYSANKVYAEDETVAFNDFKFDITDIRFEDVVLPVDPMATRDFGNIETDEDCRNQSKESNWDWTGFGIAIGRDGWEKSAPSDYDICTVRNDSRKVLREYKMDNNKLSIEYRLSAVNEVSTKDLKVQVMPDSGRDPYGKVDRLNNNQFFNGSTSRKANNVYYGVTRSSYEFLPNSDGDYVRTSYTPYDMPAIGGDINKGLDRFGKIVVDIRQSERSVDLKITYKDEVRIVRIDR